MDTWTPARARRRVRNPGTSRVGRVGTASVSPARTWTWTWKGGKIGQGRRIPVDPSQRDTAPHGGRSGRRLSSGKRMLSPEECFTAMTKQRGSEALAFDGTLSMGRVVAGAWMWWRRCRWCTEGVVGQPMHSDGENTVLSKMMLVLIASRRGEAMRERDDNAGGACGGWGNRTTTPTDWVLGFPNQMMEMAVLIPRHGGVPRLIRSHGPI
jgi:hypothetical protein